MTTPLSLLGAPWKKKLLNSLEQNKSLAYAKYVQLATIQVDGKPANRTVVFRGFLGVGDDLTFVTDRRSKKVEEVAHNPNAEACWYFPISREQYRISGQLTVVGADHQDQQLREARQLAWSNMSNSGRSQFTWPQPREVRVQDPSAFTKPAPGPQETPLDDFCLVVMRVELVDYVQLFENVRESLWIDSESGAWMQQDLNP
ncbi:hypothetical protein CEUSTIGMA_g7549.t1 [Chlamydomonas eustigma]|uniref:Pyridoxamine 5'-phosphate oxidase Alr4036 family FMN-binding domain-containing protein n=1 Tax=Chlamydomonas eustigma TaxID=1157962 RepID=A0A250XAJ1_9CHLO|nr:hypothetical protein CEUSTIGMA_g7549.t1 [Chlamydomonas eustigma]|eukprot:GAX80111.1 hypothetical protein CEUSTIGMA_g7549.t1 [Chlamydomonas eustigma]